MMVQLAQQMMGGCPRLLFQLAWLPGAPSKHCQLKPQSKIACRRCTQFGTLWHYCPRTMSCTYRRYTLVGLSNTSSCSNW